MRSITTVIAVLVLIVVTLPSDALAQRQLCEGSLGDNIFEEGDFGRGQDVIYPDDPRIAPGYFYSWFTPLGDGQYTITNNIDHWIGNWPTWLHLQDNSPDSKGYMMVVNASYEPGDFYEQVVDDVCENTLYEFSADVVNLIKRRTNNHLKPNVSFLIDGREMYNTGFIDQDETWHTVGFTFKTKADQTTVRLTLRNNAPGGMGNDLAIDNISFRACGPLAAISTDSPNEICESEEFPVLTASIQGDIERHVQWQLSEGVTEEWRDIRDADQPVLAIERLEPGDYAVRYVHAASQANLRSEKCRAASAVYYFSVASSEFAITDSIGEGESYQFGDDRLTEPGYYELAFRSNGACDSVVILNLLAKKPSKAEISVTPEVMVPVVVKPVRQQDLTVAIDILRRIDCPGDRNAAMKAEHSGGIGSVTYKWSTGAGKPTIGGLPAGLYTVSVSDSDGNTVVRSVKVEEPQPMSGQIAPIQPADAGQANGKASLVVEPVDDTYTYQWDNGETNAYALALSSGPHEVTVTNSNGCELVVTCEVASIEPPAITAEALMTGEPIRMDRLHFDADSSTIQPGSYPSLRELSDLLSVNDEMVIEIGGHTNGLPKHDYCDALSTARAKAVAEWIVNQGVDESRVFYKGYGKRIPLVSNSTQEGRAKNQRVEVKMLVLTD